MSSFNACAVVNVDTSAQLGFLFEFPAAAESARDSLLDEFLRQAGRLDLPVPRDFRGVSCVRARRIAQRQQRALRVRPRVPSLVHRADGDGDGRRAAG